MVANKRSCQKYDNPLAALLATYNNLYRVYSRLDDFPMFYLNKKNGIITGSLWGLEAGGD
jgi:hypothetical protein